MNEQEQLLQAIQDEIQRATEAMYTSIGLDYNTMGESEKTCSMQELYKRYGQYDNLFVTVELKPGSISYAKYGDTLYGSFKYTYIERKQLQEDIAQQPMPQTYGNVKFKISPVNTPLSDELITELDRDGFPIADISHVIYLPINLRNAYAETGMKSIPNQITIEVEGTNREAHEMQLVLYSKMIEQGTKLQPWQMVELTALIQLLCPDNLVGQIKEFSENPKVQHAIRLHYLLYRGQDLGLTDEENKELLLLKIARGRNRYSILEEELKISGVRFSELPEELKNAYITFLMEFEPRCIRTYPPVVWIDTDRAIHIIVRHLHGMQAEGKFLEEKTPIRYHFDDLFRLIGKVIDKVADDILQDFSKNPPKKFFRSKTRAIEYNGNYYGLDIEPSGKLLSFYPYN